MNVLLKYFPDLEAEKQSAYRKLPELYRTWNERMNLISGKDLHRLFTRHILHSLFIARIISFPPGSRVIDVGTGGGFPGIPLAIFFPEAQFVLNDSTGKKIRAVSNICRSIGLKNVRTLWDRAENVTGRFDYISGRAVTTLPEFLKITPGMVRGPSHGHPGTDILYLRGGPFNATEIPDGYVIRQYRIPDYFDEPYFKQKYLVRLNRR